MKRPMCACRLPCASRFFLPGGILRRVAEGVWGSARGRGGWRRRLEVEAGVKVGEGVPWSATCASAACPAPAASSCQAPSCGKYHTTPDLPRIHVYTPLPPAPVGVLCKQAGRRCRLLYAASPGLKPHTHTHTHTRTLSHPASTTAPLPPPAQVGVHGVQAPILCEQTGCRLLADARHARQVV